MAVHLHKTEKVYTVKPLCVLATIDFFHVFHQLLHNCANYCLGHCTDPFIFVFNLFGFVFSCDFQAPHLLGQIRYTVRSAENLILHKSDCMNDGLLRLP